MPDDQNSLREWSGSPSAVLSGLARHSRLTSPIFFLFDEDELARFFYMDRRRFAGWWVYSRFTKGRRVANRILFTTPGSFGFFSYARSVCPGTVPKPLRQIFSIMRMHNCTFLIEESFSDDALARKEKDVIVRAGLSLFTRDVTRITFFRASVKTSPSGKALTPDVACASNRAWFSDCQDLECLGYLRLYTERNSAGQVIDIFVREAVVKPLDVTISHQYIHSRAHYPVSVLGRDFVVDGSFFAQQQAEISSCGHAAVVMALKNVFGSCTRTCPIDLNDYESINRRLAIDHRARYASDGLSEQEIASLFRLVGLDCEIFDEYELDAEDILRIAYYAIEIDLPAVLVFSGSAGTFHAMTAVGHGFSPWHWRAKGEDTYFSGKEHPYKPSHSWVDSIVVQDDNLGPYCSLAVTTLRDRQPKVIVPRFSWSCWESSLIVEVYAASYLTGRCWRKETKTLFQDVLDEGKASSRDLNPWFYELLRRVADRTYILRTTPTQKSVYYSWLLERTNDIGGDLRRDIEGALGENPAAPLWLVEISIPELYQHNKHRVGELVIRPDRYKDKNGSPNKPWPALIRLPGVITITEDFANCRHEAIAYRDHDPLAGRLQDGQIPASWLNLDP